MNNQQIEATFGWIHHSEERDLGKKTLEREDVIAAFSDKENDEILYVLTTSPGRVDIVIWEFYKNSDEIRYIDSVSKLDLFTMINTKHGSQYGECDENSWCKNMSYRLSERDVKLLCDDKIKICINNPDFEYETSKAIPTIDDILDKISLSGMNSLSDDELNLLKTAYESRLTLGFERWSILESIIKDRKNGRKY